MYKTKIKRSNLIVDEIKDQAASHPDPSLREFYLALLEILKKNKKYQAFINELLEKREEINEKHLANLLYRATQYVLIFEEAKDDFAGYTKEKWLEEYENLLSNPNLLQIHQELLEHENTQTTIYQRYVGPKAAINAIFPNKRVSVLDVGCGLNLGLPGLELNYPFQDVEDLTNHKQFTRLYIKPIKIQNAVSLDLEDPVKKKKWALACGFYPGEIKNLPVTDKMCDFLWEKASVKFFKHNLLDVSKLCKKEDLGKFDVIIASTVLYQLNDDTREKAFKELHKILKLGGILIINDFVTVNHKISWSTNWFKKETSSYKTVVLVAKKDGYSEPLEFIQWESGRCKKATAGKDFTKILQLNK